MQDMSAEGSNHRDKQRDGVLARGGLSCGGSNKDSLTQQTIPDPIQSTRLEPTQATNWVDHNARLRGS